MAGKARVGPKDLGLDLKKPTDGQLFKWLVACALFGARIRQELAAEAFRKLDEAGLLTPDKLADAKWERVVELLAAGGYRRYDESTACELIAVGKAVRDDYDGRLSRLRDGADTKKQLRERLQEFPGVGPTAADIFLRETGWP